MHLHFPAVCTSVGISIPQFHFEELVWQAKKVERERREFGKEQTRGHFLTNAAWARARRAHPSRFPFQYPGDTVMQFVSFLFPFPKLVFKLWTKPPPPVVSFTASWIPGFLKMYSLHHFLQAALFDCSQMRLPLQLEPTTARVNSGA